MPPAVGVEVREKPLALNRIAVHVDALRRLLIDQHQAVVGEIEGHVRARDSPAALVVLSRARQES